MCYTQVAQYSKQQTRKLLVGKHCSDIFENAAQYYAITYECRQQLLQKQKTHSATFLHKTWAQDARKKFYQSSMDNTNIFTAIKLKIQFEHWCQNTHFSK